ncbi:MAG: RNA methyltransferase [Spirochaetia bacterium]
MTRPQGSANIGAVCRAMKACRLEHLVLVAPAAIDEQEVKKWALKGFNIYQNVQVFDTLAHAIAQSQLVVGVSRRHGRQRKTFCWTPRQFAQQIQDYPQSKITLVFGNEQNGLDDTELKYCQALVTIPTDEEVGSLNLSHAVQVCACAIFEESRPADLVKNQAWVDQAKKQDFVKKIVQRMDECQLFAQNKTYLKDLTYQRLYDILGRIPLHEGELKFLGHTMDKMMYMSQAKMHRVCENEEEIKNG